MLEAMVLFCSVWWLLVGQRKGPVMMIIVTMIGLIFEANPLANYTFEQDRTAAIKHTQTELAMVGCLMVLVASSSFRYARIIKFGD